MKLPASLATKILDTGEGIRIVQEDPGDIQTNTGTVVIYLTDEQARAVAKEVMRILEERKDPE